MVMCISVSVWLELAVQQSNVLLKLGPESVLSSLLSYLWTLTVSNKGSIRGKAWHGTARDADPNRTQTHPQHYELTDQLACTVIGTRWGVPTACTSRGENSPRSGETHEHFFFFFYNTGIIITFLRYINAGSPQAQKVFQNVQNKKKIQFTDEFHNINSEYVILWLPSHS